MISRFSPRRKLPWLIELLLYKGKLYQNIKRRFGYPRDPDDEPYLNLAIKAKADFIVTRDKDLLDLMKWDRRIQLVSATLQLQLTAAVRSFDCFGSLIACNSYAPNQRL